MAFVRRFLVLSVCGLALALGGTACSSTTPATPQVALYAQLGPGTESGVNDSSHCHLGNTQTWVTIGDDTHPVKDGDQQSSATVNVSCSVTSIAANKFHFEGIAALQGQGSLTFKGDFTNDHTADQPNIRVVWQRGDTGTYIDEGCTADYRTNSNMGVAGGRVWGNITCPHATFTDQDSVCQGVGEFRFENCSQ